MNNIPINTDNNKKPLNFKISIILVFFLFLIPLFLLLAFKFFNLFLSNPVYSSFPVFLFQFNIKSYFLSYLTLILIIIFLIFLSTKDLISKIKYDYFILILIAFLFKNILHENDYGFENINVKDIVNNFDKAGTLPTYFLYNKITLFFIDLLNLENAFILFQLNILIGAINSYFVYLISLKLFKNCFLSISIYIIFLLYLPSYSIETLLRTDTLYYLLFTSSIYLTIDLFDKYSFKKSIYIIFNFFLLILCREQTIYILPLFLFLFLINKKYYIFISLILISFLANLYLNNLNIEKFDQKLSYKNFHLIVKFMQYGYLTDYNKEKYFNKLNQDEKDLVNDIDLKYKENIFPTKRIQNNIDKNHDTRGIPDDLIYLIKPLDQSIREINKIYIPEKYLVYFHKEKENIILAINNFDNENISKKDFVNILERIQFFTDRNFFLKTIYDEIINCYLSKETFDIKQCLIHEINRYYETYIYELNDNWRYSKIGIDLSFNYYKIDNYYSSHPNINLIDNIILKHPFLYFVQSSLIFFGQSTIMPEHPIPIGKFFMEKKNIISFLIMKCEYFFHFLINFFYIFSLINLFLIQKSNLTQFEKFKFYFLSIMPLYYGFFISFSTFSEFSRLMIIISPIVVINVFIFAYLIIKNLKFFSNIK